MKVTGLELKASVQTVRLGSAAYRVVRPADPLTGWLVDRQICWNSFDGALDAHSFRALTIAWAFAARSPRTITYLPIASDGTESTALCLELVLVHHWLQLPASRWKSLRSRLGPGHVETIVLPPSAYDGREDADSWYHRENRDRFSHSVAAGTLVLAGSRPTFERDLAQLVELVEDGPAELATLPDRHVCVELAAELIHVELVGRRQAMLGPAGE
ncbi:hypothetical protein [Cellulomonas chitinilytica]|uniref:hypothetical protein n=1 Tax=Cellulomonas chitinilytica TaxID=398759 RepID=UPI0019406E9E|nr:hypothetical protein [Cellulomonas chitinilytica]